MEEKAKPLTPLESAEQAVVGAMLIDSSCIGDVSLALRDEDFIGQPYRRLYTAARDLFAAGSAVDVVTVLDKAGADLRELALACMDVTPTAKNVMHYCDILREQAALARLRGPASAMYNAQTMTEAMDAVAAAESIITGRADVQIYTLTDLMERFIRRQSAPAPSYLKWGLPMLDDMLHVGEGNYVLIGARPSTGKTALALQMGVTMAETKRVGFFSLETGEARIGDRYAAGNLPVSLPDIKAHRLTEDSMLAVTRALADADMLGRPFEVIVGADMTVADIKSITTSRRYDVIIIDYVQLIHSTVRGDRQEQMQDISIQLRAMAQRTGAVIVALAQLRRPDSNSKSKAPTMADLKESGQFEQDADVILLIYLDDPDDRDGCRVIKIEKNKDGPANYFHKFDFDGRKQRFTQQVQDRPRSPFREIDDQMALPGEWTKSKRPI